MIDRLVNWRVLNAAGEVIQSGQAIERRDGNSGAYVTELPPLATGETLEIDPVDAPT
jgi:hypothetical protein